MVRFRKIPRRFLLFTLTLGASAILGFLSFGGMYALLPIMPIAALSFALSVAYEGEIYLQNIRGALNKLGFKPRILEYRLAKDFLRNNFLFQATFPVKINGKPVRFFTDYLSVLQVLHELEHQPPTHFVRKEIKKINKKLKDMEQWFADQLFSDQSTDANLTRYQTELREWLQLQAIGLSEQNKKTAQQLSQRRKRQFRWVFAASVVVGIFMAAGSTFLLMEGFAAVPLLATISAPLLPYIIVPMAVVAGIFYCLQTYHAFTDMINNDSIRKWYFRLKESFSQGLNWRNVLLAFFVIFLATLALALTACTMGTWWTVVKNAQPLFSWMTRLPFIMGIINPIITGLAAIGFNIENTSTTLAMIDEVLIGEHPPKNDKNPKRNWLEILNPIHLAQYLFHLPGRFFQFLEKQKEKLIQIYEDLKQRENLFQLFNPFRILLKFTYTPLRILLFLGHLIGMAVTSDRVPGIPAIISAILGIISEGFEDSHYFFGHDHHGHEHRHDVQTLIKGKIPSKIKKIQHLVHERLDTSHGHSHDLDIPSAFLKKVVFRPIIILSAYWDYKFSARNSGTSRLVLDWRSAWKKHYKGTAPGNEQITVETNVSTGWEIEHSIHLVNKSIRHLENTWGKQQVKEDKKAALDQFKQELHSLENESEKELRPLLSDKLCAAAQNKTYKDNRYSIFRPEQTYTANKMAEMKDRVFSAPAA